MKQKILEQLKTMLLLKKYSLELDLPERLDMDAISKLCQKIAETGLPQEVYVNRLDMQICIAEEPELCAYLKYVYQKVQNTKALETLFRDSVRNAERITDYARNDVVDTLLLNIPDDLKYLYLKYFGAKQITNKQKEKIRYNFWLLSTHHSKEEIEEFIKAAGVLIAERYTASALIPAAQKAEILRICRNDPVINDLMCLLYQNVPNIMLSYEQIINFAESSGQYLNGLQKVFKLLEYNKEMMHHFFEYWQEVDCPLKDLKRLIQKLQTAPQEIKKTITETRSAYVNYIYGEKFKQYPLEQAASYQEDILIYAIAHGKKAFIKLVEENPLIFNEIPRNSVLFSPIFYKKLVNINTLNKNNLGNCIKMTGKSYMEELTSEKAPYTFEEIKTLFPEEIQYWDLYNMLDIARIDDKLETIRQIVKHKLLYRCHSKTEISMLAKMLSQKPLSEWMQNEFRKISFLTRIDAVTVLSRYHEAARFISEIKEREELRYILRNAAKLKSYRNMKQVREHLLDMDQNWQELIDILKLSSEFIETNRSGIYNFLLHDGAHIARTYYDALKERGKEGFSRLVRAELMGKLKEIKYHNGDLSKEIELQVTEKQIEAWKKNGRQEMENFVIEERDGFFDTMLMGAQPTKTCLYYDDGCYRSCLLSCFDSNKKILYVWKNDMIVGRALLRLTKGSFESVDAEDSMFSFADPENTEQDKKGKTNERLALFLERPYFGYLKDEEQMEAAELMIAMMEKKAREMGTVFVASSEYTRYTEARDYVLARLYLFLSKSKGGSQYLDSLGGNASVSDEGSYRSNIFLIKPGMVDSFNK